jgi:hypothetical protein
MENYVCYFIAKTIIRPILAQDVVFIPLDEFDKLANDTILGVLASDKRDDKISKSYFYFIVNKLRKLSLLIDNAIAFKVVLPIAVNGHISLSQGVMYVSNKQLVYFNPRFNSMNCGNCSAVADCVYAIKTIARDNELTVRKENPFEAWNELLSSLREKTLHSIKSMRVRIDGDNEETD